MMKRNLTTSLVATLFAMAVMLLAQAQQVFAQSDLQKAQALFNQKEYPLALPIAQVVVKANPKDVDALLLLGDIYDALDQQDSSLVQYLRAQDISNSAYYRPDVMRRVALGYSAVEKHQDALKKAQEIVKNYPKDAMSYLTLSQVYINANEQPGFADALRQADAQIIKAQGIDKNLVATYVARGDLYFAQRVYELAKDSYEEALKRDSTLTESRAKLAEAYFRLGNQPGTSKEDNIAFVNKSLAEWDKVTRADTNSVKAFYNKGRIQFLARQFKPAAATLSRYATLKPDGYYGRWLLAQAQFNVLKAEKSLDTTLIDNLEAVYRNIDTVKDRANLMLAEVLLLNRNFCKAMEKYGEINAAKPLDVEDLDKYARSAINCGDTTKAVEIYLSSFRKYPKSSCKNALPIGNLLYGLRRYDQAIEVLRVKADTANCPRDEGTVRALYYIGSSFFSQKDKGDSAVAPLQQALKLDSNALYVRNLLGQVYIDQKKDKLGKDEWMRVTELGKSNPKAKNDVTTAYQNLCRTALGSKNFAELQKYAQGWYNMYPPEDQDQNKGYACLFLAISYYQSAPDQACKYYKEVLKYLPNNKDAKIQIEQLACDSKPAQGNDKKKKK